MARSTLKKSVLSILNSHPYLAVEDFEITEYADNYRKRNLKILYICCTQWKFIFRIPDNKNSQGLYEFACSVSPGMYAEEESLSAIEESGLTAEIRSWMQRLYDDIVSTPIVRQLQIHSSDIEQLRERLDQVPDELLTRDELSEFREALDRIKEDLTAELQSVISDRDELQQRVNELSSDVKFLKDSLESFTKRQWGSAFAVRLSKWRDKLSLKQIVGGVRMLKHLLPPDQSEGLDILCDVVGSVAEVVDDKTNEEE
jgi:hypothetical protein